MLFRQPSVLQQSIFDMFRAGANGQAQPGAKPDSHIPGAPAGGPDAAALAEQARVKAAEEAAKSPLHEYATLWDDEPPAEGAAPLPNWDDPASIVPGMAIDPKKLSEAAKRLDYSKLLDPAKVKLALSGDAVAFSEIINTVSQAQFANTSAATARFVEAALKRMAPNLINEALPHHVRKHSVRETVAGDNPIFNDPAVAPMLEMMEERMRNKYPRATAKEISEHAKKMLGGFAKALTAPQTEADLRRSAPKPGDKTGVGAEDWTDFFVPGGQAQQ